VFIKTVKRKVTVNPVGHVGCVLYVGIILAKDKDMHDMFMLGIQDHEDIMC